MATAMCLGFRTSLPVHIWTWMLLVGDGVVLFVRQEIWKRRMIGGFFLVGFGGMFQVGVDFCVRWFGGFAILL